MPCAYETKHRTWACEDPGKYWNVKPVSENVREQCVKHECETLKCV